MDLFTFIIAHPEIKEAEIKAFKVTNNTLVLNKKDWFAVSLATGLALVATKVFTNESIPKIEIVDFLIDNNKKAFIIVADSKEWERFKKDTEEGIK